MFFIVVIEKANTNYHVFFLQILMSVEIIIHVLTELHVSMLMDHLDVNVCQDT
jgi:hypothetical protein